MEILGENATVPARDQRTTFLEFDLVSDGFSRGITAEPDGNHLRLQVLPRLTNVNK
jgi:hypothetical protein